MNMLEYKHMEWEKTENIVGNKRAQNRLRMQKIHINKRKTRRRQKREAYMSQSMQTP